MPYGWKIELNSTDISDKVSRFEISCSLDNFCREMVLDIADPDLYAGLDFSQISESPEIEIFTKTGTSWISQGQFFIERPALAVSIRSDLMQAVWGRSMTAMLGDPFAPKITKAWEERTTFFGICEEVCDLAGFTWNEAYSDIDDFVIHAYTYEAEGLYPIDIITELAELAGALLTTDREGHLCIKRIDYSPTAADATLTDDDVSEISERVEWPEFGNRVRITPTGALASYSVFLTAPDPCVRSGGSMAKLFAQVKDPDGEPVNGLVVDWIKDSGYSTLETPASNTQDILIANELQRASSFYTITVNFPPSSVLGVWAYSDTRKLNNLINSGHSINGNTITLTGRLAYCDQSLVISYYSEGIAVNYLTSGSVPDDVRVTASVEGQESEAIIYVENPCQCPPSIILRADPTSIHIGEVSKLLVYVEEAGEPASGRMVFMAETTAESRGTLYWTSTRLGTVNISNEQTTAKNEISGVTQCDVSMFPESITGVYLADEDGNPTGSNLYDSFSGKTINLDSYVSTGTDLVVSYKAKGAALNLFTSAELGTAKVRAWIISSSEEGLSAFTTIRVVDKSVISGDDYPADWSQDEEAEEEYEEEPGGVEGDWGDGKTLCKKQDNSYEDCAASGKVCCSKDGIRGCYPILECDGGGQDPCYTANVSGDPNDSALGARFGDGLDADCTCEEMCDNEIETYGTTQGYDSASGRTLSQIVIDDYGYGEGTPEYWEKLAELEEDALTDCLDLCDDCATREAVSWDDDLSPETIAAGGYAVVFVKDGKPPYSWQVSGLGYTLEAAETSGGSNVVYCESGT